MSVVREKSITDDQKNVPISQMTTFRHNKQQ